MTFRRYIRILKYIFLLIEQRIHYKMIGDSGMRCGNLESVYTYKRNSDCQGWKGISLAECKAKCTNNEIPSQCPRQGVKCAFIHYIHDRGGCQLADDSCIPEKTYIYTFTLHKKFVKRGMDDISYFFQFIICCPFVIAQLSSHK